MNVTVAPIDLAVSLEVSGDAFGADADVLWSGATFWVNAYVQDRRDVPQGVVGGAVDIQFDPLLVVPTGNTAYGEDFSAFQQGWGDATHGEIDEAGAISVASDTGARGMAPFVAWEFVVVGGPDFSTAGPRVEFTLAPAEGTATIAPADFALIGDGEPVAWDRVALRGAKVDLYFGDFNGDRLVNHFDLALWQVHANQAVESLASDRRYDLDQDGEVGGDDLDLLLAAMYRPVAPPTAPSVDSKTAEGEQGISSGTGEEPLVSGDRLLAIDEVFARDDLWRMG